MKTAISLPNEIFNEAERFAERAKMNRSKLYGSAIAEYLARHSGDEVTEAMNQVVDRLNETWLDKPRLDKPSDQFSSLAAKYALGRVEW